MRLHAIQLPFAAASARSADQHSNSPIAPASPVEATPPTLKATELLGGLAPAVASSTFGWLLAQLEYTEAHPQGTHMLAGPRGQILTSASLVNNACE